ncbi:pepsin/retropepsin-like aspartic protease family protein [Ferruginibacter sp. HRS2-29]|uniref:pepsin/retropepsin-like aspartic protease family protein n=1 Tax=Ferruginibacter sp. HRS2-29 TaxID=2487334 RepID=UPI0020CD8826|nr:pepsin/retropepsin-like aspartic protease family protein [Ferruginibacter sp. HRS2-29]
MLCCKKYHFIAPAWMILLLCMTGLAAGAKTKEPPHASLKSICFPGVIFSADSSSFSIPFSRAGNLLLIKAKADSTEGNFILDTGCPGLVLNITYFRNYPVVIESSSDESVGMTGASTGRQQVSIKDFHFGGITEHNVMGDLANLGNIENSKGVKVLGLVGMHFLKECELIIDYQQNLMFFHIMGGKQARKYQNPLLADTSTYHTVPFELTDNRIIVKTTMEGKKVRFVIDCAAETNVLDSRLPEKVFENLSITGRVSLVGVGNKKVEAVKGSLGLFRIGTRNISDLPVLITNLEKTCFAFGGCVDGVLGINELSVQKIGFNFTTYKMYLWK